MRKLLLGLIGLLFAVPAVATDLPAGYTELQYIESTGTQWIDTGIKGNMSYKYEIDFQQLDSNTYRNWGAFNQQSYSGGPNMSFTYSTGFAVRWTVSGNQEQQVNSISAIDANRHKIIIDNGNVTWDGVSKGRSTGHRDNYQLNYNLFLGTINPGGTTPTTNAKSKYYSYKVWNTDGNLIQNFVPAKRNSDNVIGMYDTVSGQLFTNAGTGTFVAGPVVPEQQIRIATTAYNSARFSPVVTELNDTIATIRSVVTNTINQTKAIADLQATKQTRPDETCPAGKKCLLVEDDAGQPHWYEIIENAYGLPNGYTALEYIQSTGTQYIDTGVKPYDVIKTRGNKFVVKMGYRENSVFTTRSLVGMNSIYLGVTADNYYESGANIIRNVSPNRTTFDDLEFIAQDAAPYRELKVNGTTVSTYSTSPVIEQDLDFRIFGYKTTSATGSVAPMFGAVSYVQVYENNTQVRNFIPARRNSDDVLGMYDTVNGQFYTNQGTGDFVAGPEI